MFTVYTRDNCRYCTAAKGLITSMGFSAHEGNLTLIDASGASIKESLKEAGFSTLPVIYYNGFLIGGFRELQTVVRESFTKGYPNVQPIQPLPSPRPANQAPEDDIQAPDLWNF